VGTIDTDEELLSVRRTASKLGLAKGTTYRLIRNGVIPAVDEWLGKHRTAGGAPATVRTSKSSPSGVGATSA